MRPVGDFSLVSLDLVMCRCDVDDDGFASGNVPLGSVVVLPSNVDDTGSHAPVVFTTARSMDGVVVFLSLLLAIMSWGEDGETVVVGDAEWRQEGRNDASCMTSSLSTTDM